MATTTLLLHTISSTRANPSLRTCCTSPPSPSPSNSNPNALTGRRQSIFLLTASTMLTAVAATRAEDIPLFGLRKKLKKVEEEAVVIVKEGFETAEKGLETAEIGIETVEKGIETAEKEVETVLGFGNLAQAGVVAAAEVVGVVIATSIVNGILGPEGQKS
ncbi:hypothetical protein GIB67_005410 [Kingdonia uniflora]|uniref:Uncharacterized protein n=1 Tax=Kingdonia uniflora TaxID=39325 RepID=A0A7J7NI16_9MAGN|nr:hypothetical protein GIB67_005410 [Kingdonia uniflora]